MDGGITRREALRSAALGGLALGALGLSPAEALGAAGAGRDPGAGGLSGDRVPPPADAAAPVRPADRPLTGYVDPFIGTGGHGHTYPGATVPFGMVQLSPDSGNQGWDWCSGYNAADRVIAGFSHTHLSGTGIGDLCDVLVTPVVLGAAGLPADLRFSFDHAREEASPGYYAVELPGAGIRAELTATRRVGLHRYTFRRQGRRQPPAVVVDLGFAINWDAPVDTELRLESPSVLSGMRRSRGWARDQHVYFVMHFSRPVVRHELEDRSARAAGAARRSAGVAAAVSGRAVRGVFAFGPAREPLLVKVGISAVDVEGARRNLEGEAAGWDFDAVRAAAAGDWQRALSAIRVDRSGAAVSPDPAAPAGAPDPARTTFYTALYHALLAPTLYSDVDGRYRGADLQVHRAEGFENYTTFSLWDTFRAEHPLLTLVQPRRVDDLCRAMMAFYREGGLLPVWSLMANETNTMIGYHAVPVLAEALAKGLTRVSPVEALEAMKKSALQDASGLRFYRPPQPSTLQALEEAAARTKGGSDGKPAPPVEEAVRLADEYALVGTGEAQRQVIRAEIAHVGPPADAVLQAEGAEAVEARVASGTTIVFLPAPKVETPRQIDVAIRMEGLPARTTRLELRPVRPYDYIPADRENESVSKTLEYAYDDACIARFAATLGRSDDATEFARRAGFFRSLFDPGTGFMRGRLADGTWKTPFSPRFSSHRQDEYTEGNAWQYTWFVPHDVAGLIELAGGRERFVARLDELFDQSAVIEGGNASPDISGLIGQYAHGNEPSHHIAYLYAYAGAPWKTQARVRQITQTLYHARRDGLCGNEDCGQMSAWYVFAALGFYPVDPASGLYVIGSPHFDRVTLDVGGGRTFTIVAPGAAERPYIREATLNGRPLERCWLRHAELTAGGELAFAMSATPERAWASGPEGAPPSMSTGGRGAAEPPSPKGGNGFAPQSASQTIGE